MKLEDIRKNAREGRPLAVREPDPEVVARLKEMCGDPLKFAKFLGADSSKMALFNDFIVKERDIDQHQVKVYSPARFNLKPIISYLDGI